MGLHVFVEVFPLFYESFGGREVLTLLQLSVFQVLKCANHCWVTTKVYIFTYSKHKNFIPQCPLSFGVYTLVLLKHPVLLACPQPFCRCARRMVVGQPLNSL